MKFGFEPAARIDVWMGRRFVNYKVSSYEWGQINTIRASKFIGLLIHASDSFRISPVANTGWTLFRPILFAGNRIPNLW